MPVCLIIRVVFSLYPCFVFLLREQNWIPSYSPSGRICRGRSRNLATWKEPNSLSWKSTSWRDKKRAEIEGSVGEFTVTQSAESHVPRNTENTGAKITKPRLKCTCVGCPNGVFSIGYVCKTATHTEIRAVKSMPVPRSVYCLIAKVKFRSSVSNNYSVSADRFWQTFNIWI